MCVCASQVLLGISEDVIRRKQQAISILAPSLQYSIPPWHLLYNASDRTAWEPPFQVRVYPPRPSCHAMPYHAIVHPCRCRACLCLCLCLCVPERVGRRGPGPGRHVPPGGAAADQPLHRHPRAAAAAQGVGGGVLLRADTDAGVAAQTVCLSVCLSVSLVSLHYYRLQ